jgi:hypothetical protein
MPVGQVSIAVSIEPRWISRASLITGIFIDVTWDLSLIKIWPMITTQRSH